MTEMSQREQSQVARTNSRAGTQPQKQLPCFLGCHKPVFGGSQCRLLRTSRCPCSTGQPFSEDLRRGARPPWPPPGATVGCAGS